MKQSLLYAFLLLTLGAGLSCAFFPKGVVAFRRRNRLSAGFWSGGFFYATERRARVTGTLVALVALFGLFVMLTR
jgi:hypothetical protein